MSTAAEELSVLLDAFWTEVHDLGMVTGTGDRASTREAYRVAAIEARAELEAGVNAALAAERQAVVEHAAQIADVHAERLKHTSHRDGLGMGWLAGEEMCREIGRRIRALTTPSTAETEEADHA